MPKLPNLQSFWNTIREIDLKPIRQQAEQEIRLALLSDQPKLAQQVVAQLRSDPNHAEAGTQTPVLVLGLDQPVPGGQADLCLLIGEAGSLTAAHHERLQALSLTGQKALLLVNTAYPQNEKQADLVPTNSSTAALTLVGPFQDGRFLQEQLVPQVLKWLPGKQIALARQFPLFREAVARELISETCLSNTAYSLSTGLAELLPVLNLPLNVTDMVVLTKAQAFLVYKLGLALGYATDWQSYVTEFGGVLGGGFVWRQLARSLVGLVPAWGIIPKVAVAYSGTYVVGQAVYQWYLTGRHLTPEQLQALYRQAFLQGRRVAENVRARLPVRQPKTTRVRKRLLPKGRQVCPDCGKKSSADAIFCQYCGRSFGILLDLPGDVIESEAVELEVELKSEGEEDNSAPTS